MEPLYLGATGDDVMSLQLALVAIGLLGGEPTGQFDQVTQRAVIEVQRRARLNQTGVVDDATWSAIWQMQASVAPSPDTNTPGVGARPGTTYTDPLEVAGRGPSQGQLLFWGLAAGAAYWFANRDKFKHGLAGLMGGGADEDDDEDEEDDYDDDFEDDEDDDEPEDQPRLSELNDAVTDSLIDEPAVISQSGRAGDCKKAAMRLMRVQALVQRPSERSLYDRVVRKVATNCRGEEASIQDAITEAAERRAEAEEELGSKLTEGLETKRTETPEGSRKRTFVEPGFRKTKHKLTRKTTTEPAAERSGKGKGQGHRRGASAVDVRRGGRTAYKMRKEKAKTKRGYTWRKENN